MIRGFYLMGLPGLAIALFAFTFLEEWGPDPVVGQLKSVHVVLLLGVITTATVLASAYVYRVRLFVVIPGLVVAGVTACAMSTAAYVAASPPDLESLTGIKPLATGLGLLFCWIYLAVFTRFDDPSARDSSAAVTPPTWVYLRRARTLMAALASATLAYLLLAQVAVSTHQEDPTGGLGLFFGETLIYFALVALGFWACFELFSSHPIQGEQDAAGGAFAQTLVSVLPLIGFLGTVIGIARSLQGFGSIYTDTPGADAVVKSAFSQSIGGLSVAFETTILGILQGVLLLVCGAFFSVPENTKS